MKSPNTLKHYISGGLVGHHWNWIIFFVLTLWPFHLVTCQSVTNIFEYSNILVTNIHSDIRWYQFFFYEYIRTFVGVKFVCSNIFGHSFMSVFEYSYNSQYAYLFGHSFVSSFVYKYIRIFMSKCSRISATKRPKDISRFPVNLAVLLMRLCSENEPKNWLI